MLLQGLIRKTSVGFNAHEEDLSKSATHELIDKMVLGRVRECILFQFCFLHFQQGRLNVAKRLSFTAPIIVDPTVTTRPESFVAAGWAASGRAAVGS
jgi:hypothetical protein